MDDQVQALVAEQIAYYRAHAPDYDVGYLGNDDWDRCIEELPIAGDVLELACGTGHWTPLLAARARSVTALDAARRRWPWPAGGSRGCRSSSSRPTCSPGGRRAASTRCSSPSG
jgi:SAM-dependent methyltransferase